MMQVILRSMHVHWAKGSSVRLENRLCLSLAKQAKKKMISLGSFINISDATYGQEIVEPAVAC
jgi:hypothetical protein